MTLIPFNYNEQQLRVVEIDGEPWFVLAARRASWVAHIALILLLTAIGPDSLLVAALALLVARTLWTLTPKATLS